MLGCNSRISGEVILFSTKTLCHMAQGITCYSVYLFYNDTLVSYNLFTHLAMNLNQIWQSHFKNGSAVRRAIFSEQTVSLMLFTKSYVTFA